MSACYGSEYMSHFTKAQVVGGKKIKTVRLEDELETFEVRFRVHIPEYDPNSEMRLLVKDTIVKSSGGAAREGEGYRMMWAH